MTSPLSPVLGAPAVGEGGRLPRRQLVRRLLAALLLLALLGAAKVFVSARESGSFTLGALPGGHLVAPGLVIGGTPQDTDLQTLADSYAVAGVINLAGPSVAEQVTTAALHQSYLNLPLAPGTAPTWPQLAALAAFMRAHGTAGHVVYLHDTVGGGQAVTAADMLLLLRGESATAISRDMTTAELQSLDASQRRAIRELAAALAGPGRGSRANPYASAQLAGGQW
jgi:hypothetical protein